MAKHTIPFTRSMRDVETGETRLVNFVAVIDTDDFPLRLLRKVISNPTHKVTALYRAVTVKEAPIE